MSEQSPPLWRNALGGLVNLVSAEKFRQNLPLLRESRGDDPFDVGVAYISLLLELFVESAGMFAALQLPPQEVPAALAEIRETVTHLGFEREREHLSKTERRYYDRFADMAASLFVELSAGMEALLNCYVAGEYTPDSDPDDLITEALEIADEDIERARHLIVQAGAIALHGRPLWWRWQVEAYGPAAPWLTTIADLVEDYTDGGRNAFGPPDQARAWMEAMIQRWQGKAREELVEDLEQPDAVSSPVDDLIYELIEDLIEQGSAPFTPEQLALCKAHREEAIPALIDLAADKDLQLEEAPGGGYAPIRAVELLGELKAVEAIPVLIDIVADTETDAIIFGAAIHALKKIGPPVLGPVLAFMRYSRDVEGKVSLAEVIDEVCQEDERVYRLLVTVWEEVAWEDGKCLLAYALARTGGQRAVPLLEAALEDPGLDSLIDYNTVADALETLGVQAPPPPPALSEQSIWGLRDFLRSLLLSIGDPERLMDATDTVPELRSYPDNLAHIYAETLWRDLIRMVVMQVMALLPGASLFLIISLIEAVEEISFDASTRGYPRWLRQTYDHLAECAGPDLQSRLLGVYLALQHYFAEDYDIADAPDQLLAAARAIPPSSDHDEERRYLFAQAGALVLHGRPLWPLWLVETDPPLSNWLDGLIEFHRLLGRIGQIPLRPSPDVAPDDLSVMLSEALTREEDLSPADAKLLDLLLERRQDTLSPAQRRRFTHRRTSIAPHLIRMVEDRRYWLENGPGGGWAAILAVRLLGELKVAQAADTLVGAVNDSNPDDLIHDAALFSLMAIGRLALPAVQAYFRYGRNVGTKTSLAEVLGRIGRRSPDTFDLLRQVWESADWAQNRRVVALAFGDLRDSRAVPLLRTALEDKDADGLDLSYVCWALQQLGRPVSPPVEASSRLNVPAPHNPRLIYDEFDLPQRLSYTVWGEPLCPDCGQPLVQNEAGEWIHPPEPLSSRPAPKPRKRKRRKKRRR